MVARVTHKSNGRCLNPGVIRLLQAIVTLEGE
jgi:hypothetical protein